VLETVGVGQDELDVSDVAHSTVVVLAPGMGDDIQAVKSGILEIADVFVSTRPTATGPSARSPSSNSGWNWAASSVRLRRPALPGKHRC